MYRRLLDLCRCPLCRARFELIALAFEAEGQGDEIATGLLGCSQGHWFPVVRGVPRLYPGALREHWAMLEPLLARSEPRLLDSLLGVVRGEPAITADARDPLGDPRTRAHFDRQWQQHELGARTWGLDLDERVRSQFLDPVRLGRADLAGKIVLDAGCGNGSQSVAYTELGVEVIGIDLSIGVDKGQAYRRLHAGARPERVHFIQADLREPPLAGASVDIILAEGTLYHTPDTHETFLRLASLLRPGGLFYVTLFKYERYVTPLVNGVRALTTRVPPPAFAEVAKRLAVPFLALRHAVTALGLRSYPVLTRSEAAVALMDLLGPPRAHYHRLDEVIEWYRSAAFDDVWVTGDWRRSFGVCGRLGPDSTDIGDPPRADALTGALVR